MFAIKYKLGEYYFSYCYRDIKYKNSNIKIYHSNN